MVFLCVTGIIALIGALISLHHSDPASYVSVQQAAATPDPTPDIPPSPSAEEKAHNWKIIEDMRKGIVQATPTPETPHLIMGDNKANYKEQPPEPTVKHKTPRGLIVDNKEDADATHIYFGPTSDRDQRTATETKFDYDENPKAYVQGGKMDGNGLQNNQTFPAKKRWKRSCTARLKMSRGKPSL